MKAKTLRPLTIILLFGFLSTNGWMVVRDGADHRVIRDITAGAALAGAGARGHAAATPIGATRPGTLYATPWASSTTADTGKSTPYGVSGTPAAPGAAPAPGLQQPILVTANDPSGPAGGFGDFGIPGAPLAAGPTAPRAGSRDPGSGSRDGTGSGSTGSSGNGSSGLLDPPGATAAPGSGGGSSIGGDGNHQVIVAEPSTLALFLAGAAGLGLALRRRHAAR